MSILEELIVKLNYAISGSISLTEFSNWYEEWFNNIEDEISLDSSKYHHLENLYSDIGFYEPNESLRAEHISYFGDDKLLEMLKKTLEILKSR